MPLSGTPAAESVMSLSLTVRLVVVARSVGLVAGVLVEAAAIDAGDGAGDWLPPDAGDGSGMTALPAAGKRASAGGGALRFKVLVEVAAAAVVVGVNRKACLLPDWEGS